MGRSLSRKYDDIAVIFHWLIALLIISLLAVGKFMTGLEENDPLRYVLTQWHKTFGITALVLSVLRLLWRFTHKPPAEPDYLPNWQKHISGLVHLALYALMLGLPITGWIMVSASPLNIDTMLFGVIPWPHLPPFPTLENREAIAAAFHDYHEYASTALIILILAHIGAALKHHFIDKDDILQRMLPSRDSSSFKTKVVALVALIAVTGVSLFWYNTNRTVVVTLAAGDSAVSFVADVTGEATSGLFTQSTVEAFIDETNPTQSDIRASVITASITSSNYQVADALPDPDWFDVVNHPEAIFQSTSVTAGAASGELLVVGDLTMKETTQSVEFTMSLSDEDGRRIARGGFPVDRREYSIGLESQNTDDFVGFEVQINFKFEIIAATE